MIIIMTNGEVKVEGQKRLERANLDHWSGEWLILRDPTE
jgi:hypothetical protein